MKQRQAFFVFLVLFAITLVVLLPACSVRTGETASRTAVTIDLPKPSTDGRVSVEKAISLRRSVRSYADTPLTLGQVSQVLWAAQGITDEATGHRAAPSAVATYPLVVYLVAGNVKGLAPGVYRYEPKGHKLVLAITGDQRAGVSNQQSVKDAPATLAMVVDYSKTAKRFGDKAREFAAIEAGAAGENVHLQAVALGLSTVTVGGIDPAAIKKTLALPENQEAMYIIPVGKKR